MTVRPTCVIAVLVALSAAACGGETGPTRQPATETPAASASSATGGKAQLYEAARREGALTIWGPATDTISRYFPEEFTKAFPGIEVTGISDNQAPAKVITEIRAGVSEADAVWWPYTGVTALAERDLLARFTPEELAAFGIQAGEVDLDGRALRSANFVYGVIYNTERFTPAALPTSWEALATEQWRGRSVGSALAVPFLIAGLGVTSKDEAWALDYARKLRAAQVAMVSDPVLGVEMILRGERDLLVSTPAVALQRHRTQGLPIAWHGIGPTVGTQHVAVAIAKGPHPHAARLWALWAASEEGQRAMDAASFEASARPGAPTTLARLVAEAGIEVFFETPAIVKPRLALHDKVRPILTGEER